MKSSQLITPIIATILCSLASVTLYGQAETQNPTFPFWKIKGNAGTDTSSNFVGTTDAEDLTFRTNNVRRVTINQSGFVGIGTIVPVRMLELSGLTNGIRIGGLATGGSFITAPSATTDKLLFADANGDVRAIANGSSGQVLTINGSGVPAWTTSSSSAWNLTGNSGTVDGTNFIGTTDNIPFNVRVNNQTGGRIDHILHNAFWGHRAGFSNSTGRSNVAVGKDALYTNSTASNLVAVGDSALYSQTTGSSNTGLGNKVLYSNQTGSRNTAIGDQAMYTNVSGADNTAVGQGAMYTNTGTGNTAVGAGSLPSLTSGNYNTAGGMYSMYGTNTAGSTTAYGSFSFYTANGSYNVAIGNNTLTSTSGNSNTAVGYNAGISNSTGSRNTFLGDSANVTTAGLTNSTSIGWNARVGQSNSIVLGSVQGSNGATATPRVGIGTTAPARALHIANDTLGLRYEGVSTGGSFITATSATTDKILYADANGDIKAMTAGSTNDVLTYTASGPAWAAAGGGSSWALTGNSGTTAGTNFIGTTDGVDFVIKTNNTEAMRALSTGQISINQSTPASGDLFSVYSTNSDDGVNIFANGSGRGMFVSVSSANNSGDGIEVSKSGGTNSSGGRGVDIYMNTTTNGDIGLAVSHNGTGRAGNFQQQNTASSNPAVFASVAGNGRAFSGQNSLTTSTNAVGFFSQASTGTIPATYQFAAAVYGQTNGIRSGVFTSYAASSNTTVLQGTFNGTAGNDDGIGVLGSYVGNTGYGYGVVGTGNLYGVFANADVGASGTKPFQIDHPLDPYNKYLKHYSMESPEVLNVYRGNVVLDANGEAIVTMPDYFDSVTTNCSYSLTAIGTQTNVYIKQEIHNREFVIAGGAPGQKVCWFVYGNRNDLYVRNNPQSSAVEVQKREHEKGKLMRPELYGQPESLGVFYNYTNKQSMVPDGNVKDAPEKKK